MREHLKPLTDDSPMPFGKYEGTKLGDVPADYLLWLLRQDWIGGWRGLHNYLKSRQDILLEELDESEKDDHDEREFNSYQDFLDYL